MKILITGATGFMGKVLCTKLRRDGHSVVGFGSLKYDLTKDSSEVIFKKGHFDLIYHLASWTQAGDFCLYHQGEQWLINEAINVKVLTCWKKYQSQAKMVCIGSSCAYDPYMDAREENYLLGTPHPSLLSYAMTKRMLYIGLLSINKQFGLKYLYVVPDTLYGPGYHTDARQMHFIFDIIRKIIRGKIYGEDVILWGNGKQIREIVFIDDFVRILIELSKKHDNDIVNIAPGQAFSIRYYAKLICKIVGYDFKKIIFDTSKYVGAEYKCLNINKLKNLVPNYKFTPLEEGLNKTIKWFWQNKNKILSL